MRARPNCLARSTRGLGERRGWVGRREGDGLAGERGEEKREREGNVLLDEVRMVLDLEDGRQDFGVSEQRNETKP